MAELFWFSDAQWARIAPLLPTNTRGMKRVDDRRVLSGIVHVLKSTGPELGFLTGGFHLDLPASIANIARLSGVDIKIDENGDWTYQGRKIDDIAAE
ncbi:MAG: hypothetical protein SFV19_04300, partial [Rhodospirillaceae bacterium]|nr:hypothetical protein [Rhodospirillaceae bacterium]